MMISISYLYAGNSFLRFTGGRTGCRCVLVDMCLYGVRQVIDRKTIECSDTANKAQT